MYRLEHDGCDLFWKINVSIYNAERGGIVNLLKAAFVN